MKIASLVCILLVGCGGSDPSGNGGSAGTGGGGSGGSGGGVGGNGGSGGSGGGSAGSGGSGGGGGSGGSSGGVADMSGGFSCGNVTCGAGLQCCINLSGTTSCAASCNDDGGFAASCHTAADCNGNPCCISIVSYKPAGVMCGTSPTSCTPSINLTTGSGTDHTCNADADCAGSMLPNCCTNTQSGQKVCFNKSYTTIVTAFTCP